MSMYRRTTSGTVSMIRFQDCAMPNPVLGTIRQMSASRYDLLRLITHKSEGMKANHLVITCSNESHGLYCRLLLFRHMQSASFR